MNSAWMRGAEAADEVLSDCLQAASCADKNAAEQLAEASAEETLVKVRKMFVSHLSSATDSSSLLLA